jgi:hypothetical protein
MCASRVFDCVPAFFCACLVGIHIARQPSVCASRVSDCVPAFMCVCLVGIYIARQPSVCASRVSDCVPAFLCACLVGNLDSAPTLCVCLLCVRLRSCLFLCVPLVYPTAFLPFSVRASWVFR